MTDQKKVQIMRCRTCGGNRTSRTVRNHRTSFRGGTRASQPTRTAAECGTITVTPSGGGGGNGGGNGDGGGNGGGNGDGGGGGGNGGGFLANLPVSPLVLVVLVAAVGGVAYFGDGLL